jgi:uncharacterized protein (DUF3820 family)
MTKWNTRTALEEQEKQIEKYEKYWPVGKVHKGKRITEVPNKYLKWVSESFTEDNIFSRALCIAADRELQYRIKHDITIEE